MFASLQSDLLECSERTTLRAQSAAVAHGRVDFNGSVFCLRESGAAGLQAQATLLTFVRVNEQFMCSLRGLQQNTRGLRDDDRNAVAVNFFLIDLLECLDVECIDLNDMLDAHRLTHMVNADGRNFLTHQGLTGSGVVLVACHTGRGVIHDDNGNRDYYRQLDVDYQEVNVQALYTYYFSNNTFRPYVFIGPRVSVPMSGKMIWQKKVILDYGTPEQHFSETGVTVDTVEMTAQNTRKFNVGLVAGVGLLYKLNVGNYYIFIKADVSGHAAVINSFTSEEIHGESQNVIGAGYIDPYLLGMRFNTDVTAKITFMFPLKKQLQGACIRWGEYD